MIRGTFWKKYFHTMSHIRHMTSFVNVILLIFSNYITWLLFQALRNSFLQKKIMIEVVQHNQRNILKISYYSYYALSSTYDVIRDVILSFWLILQIKRCLKHLDLDFRIILIIFEVDHYHWRDIKKKEFFISCPVSDVWRYLETSFCHFYHLMDVLNPLKLGF